MKTEATATAPTIGPDPAPDRLSAVPSRSAGLLSLVHNLIAFGQALLHTLQASPAATALSEITLRFGTRDIALIIARISRGLMLAANLQARLAHGASRLDAPPAKPAETPAPAADSAPKRERTTGTKPPSQQEDDAALLAGLPTAQQIATQLSGKPIGVVLEQICQDLGITCAHPLWSALNQAIIHNGGSVMRPFDGILARLKAGYALLTERLQAAIPTPPPGFALFGTGPP